MEGHSPMDSVPDTLARIERKLDILIAALAEEDEPEQPAHTLDGGPAGSERDASQPLG